MQEFIILNQEEVGALLNMKDVINAVEDAYRYKCSGRGELFPLVCHEFKEGMVEFDIKSSSADGAGVFGMKLVSFFPENSTLKLPRLTGTILLFDRKTGFLRSMMDGSLITNMRTGAAGGAGCRFLARPDSESLLLVGTGAQGPVLLEAALSVMENISRVMVYNAHSFERADCFAEQMREKPWMNCEVEASDNLEKACSEADIILTATPCRNGLIESGWVRPGTHLSCIGSDMEGKQELAEALLERSRVFCDDLAQVIEVGECEKAVKKKILLPSEITELGDVILGKAEGRKTDEDITIFDSTGIGLQDLLVASALTKLAEEKGTGIKMKL